MTIAWRNVIAVIVIIMLLAGFLLPALQIPSKGGRRLDCQNNLRQIAQAGVLCNTHSGYLPPARSWPARFSAKKNAFPEDFAGNPEEFAYTWVQPLLPYLGSTDIAQELAGAPETAHTYGVRIPLLMCPSDWHEGEGPASLSYAINAGRANCDSVAQNHDWQANGGSHDALRQQQDLAAYRRNRLTLAGLTDGASNTIAFAENVFLRTWCVDPAADPPVTSITEFHSGIIWDPNVSSFPHLPAFDDRANDRGGVNLGPAYAHPSSRHPGGFNLAMWDGSSRFVNNDIDYTVYARLMSSDGRRTQDPCVAEYVGPTPSWQATPLTGGY